MMATEQLQQEPIILHIELENESILSWLTNNRFIVHSEIVRFSEILIKKKLEVVRAIIVANLLENIVFIVKRNDVKQTLQKAMEYFLGIEEYEQCAKIRELLILIEKDSKK
jgi:hypothetical protein